ncbi:MAG: GNAT family N-acetyltransferase [Candidatus Gastranaerophilales bacterium]|nr:GNAT family N-acetyltransferase [Candidatus Gastranaerophilales bacterium]
MIPANTIKYHSLAYAAPSFSGRTDGVEKVAEKLISEIKLANIYGTEDIAKVRIKDKLYDVHTTGGEYFSIKDNKNSLGFMIVVPRMYEGKTCYSVAELRNETGPGGLGTKLMQIGLKAHKDSGKTGEFRAHDVLLEAEEFYEKLGFIEDPKREGQWFLPKENEHILQNYKGGL